VQYSHSLPLPVQGSPTTSILRAGPVGEGAGTCWTLSVVAATPTVRPVVFVFNGGPGVSSMWLQLSGLAPWRAAVSTDLCAAPDTSEPLEVIGSSLFDSADLVFVDPPGTGLDPHPAPAHALGAEPDAALFADAIATWLADNGREEADVFLLGESYGTIRAALISARLERRHPTFRLRGIALLGQCLNAQEVTQRPGNYAGYVAALPFVAATAWYHGLGAHGGRPLEDVVSEAREFAVTEYATALTSGSWPAAVRQALAGLSGLAPETLAEQRHRIDKEWFRRNVLATSGEHVGLTDSRYRLSSEAAELDDAASSRLEPTFAAARTELHSFFFNVPRPTGFTEAYEAHEAWNYQEASAEHEFGGSPLPSPFALFDYPRHLGTFLEADPSRRVFIGTGHFDALTTVGGVDHLLAQYGLPNGRFDRHEYPAGHMMYSDPATSDALIRDLKQFLSVCSPATTHATLEPSHV
jgi:carboxypeptidase C (cathepsin A)